jgi:hypothetical protein
MATNKPSVLAKRAIRTAHGTRELDTQRSQIVPQGDNGACTVTPWWYRLSVIGNSRRWTRCWHVVMEMPLHLDLVGCICADARDDPPIGWPDCG